MFCFVFLFFGGCIVVLTLALLNGPIVNRKACLFVGHLTIYVFGRLWIYEATIFFLLEKFNEPNNN